MSSLQVWFYWALLSAVFASLTAIFAKIGLEGVDSDFATLIRTVIILIAISWFVYVTGKWTSPFALRPRTWWFLTFVRFGYRCLMGLLFSCLASRRSLQGGAGR